MPIQTKCMRRRSIAIALLLGCPLFVPGQCALADGPSAKEKTKQVPAYVAAQFDKPKVRSIHTNKATIRSGPSERYYATSTLTSGATVDVYMETSDGWSGIRPPAGSHDWIPSNIAYLLPGGKSAEIIEDKSPAWVGSDSPDVSEFMWQMELVKSQQVQVLGEELQMTDDGKKQLWYRISPPQGEFRWIKTSQLSDSPPVKSMDRSVQLANHVEDTMPIVGKPTQAAKPTAQSGKVVWSDEQQALDQVEQQIQREQSEIQSKMAADGVHVNMGSPKIEVQPRSIHAKQISYATKEFGSGEPESVLVDNEETDFPTAQTTRIRPMVAHPKPKRTVVSANSTEHQLDGQRQWEAMQTTDPKLRIRPVSSLLGLIGLSVVEADRAPATTRIAQQYHANPSQGNIGRVGQVGNSRLDRLPRPGQHRPNRTLPPDASTTMGGSMGMNGDGSYTIPVPSGAPLNPGETTFSRWLNSREPLFGSSPSPLQPMPSMSAGTGPQFAPQTNGLGNPYASPVQANPVTLDTTAWHGLNPSLRTLAVLSPDNSNYDNSNHEEDPEEFQTPEIQSALVQLTREVASPTEGWNFSALRNQAASWVENGATAMVRGEARLLVERIERFESLRQRTLGFAQDTSRVAQQSFDSAALASVRPASNVSPASANTGANGNLVSNAVATNAMTEGDASGWLVQVHTSIKGQPEFALTDDAGKVITYVQSTASLNLRRYLQQPVTVYGVRGYIPNLAAKQILAERVVRMR